MKIIDAHCHIHKPQWNIPEQEEKDVFSRYQNESGDENQILANMAEAGVDQTIIFPYASILINLEVANHYTVAVSRRYTDKFIP